jgi:triacylglycerol lipase
VLSSLAPARRRLVLAVISAIIAAVLSVTALVVLRRDGSPSRPVNPDQATPGPVILVPGYGGSTSALTVLAQALRQAGRDVSLLSLPGDGRGDLRAQAQVLAREVDAVRTQTGASSVDVVGYSAGGVVARLWVRDDGGAKLARRVITLGSPHHGTDLAAFAGSLLPDACPLACQQLAPDSELLASLDADDETPPGPQFISVWTTVDRVVVPPESADLAGAIDFSVQSVCATSRVDHGSLPSDPIVRAMVIRELGAGPPVTLTAADCASLQS